MPVGPFKTTAGLSGAIPQQSLTGVTRYTEKRLFYSLREQALLLPKTIRGGFGVLEAGQIMGVIYNKADYPADAAQGTLCPYVPSHTSYPAVTAFTSIAHDAMPGVCPVLSTVSTTTINLNLERSWMFKVGDECIIRDNDTVDNESVTISAIDRTTYDYQAVATVVGLGGAFTAAQMACMFLRHGDAALESSGTPANVSIAKYILDQTVDTGFVDQGGALASVVVSNAILYAASLVNCDADAISDLSLVADGDFYILK